jgi:hypothetical protein
MKVLLISTVLYLLGVAIVLFWRPALMFHADGRWKEFGLRPDESTTVFPFWFFCIVWALGSLLLTRLVVPDTSIDVTASAMTVAGVTTAAESATSRIRSVLEDAVLEESNQRRPVRNEDYLTPLPPVPPATATSKKRSNNGTTAGKEESPKPGYYKLKGGSSSKKSKIPRYIFIGEKDPASSSDTEDSEED